MASWKSVVLETNDGTARFFGVKDFGNLAINVRCGVVAQAIDKGRIEWIGGIANRVHELTDFTMWPDCA